MCTFTYTSKGQNFPPGTDIEDWQFNKRSSCRSNTFPKGPYTRPYVMQKFELLGNSLNIAFTSYGFEIWPETWYIILAKPQDVPFKAHPYVYKMYQNSCQILLPYEANVVLGWVSFHIMAHTHVRIEGQNLNFYLKTHATPQNIYFIRLRILPRNLVHYTGVCITLKGSYTRPYKRPKFELLSVNSRNSP